MLFCPTKNIIVTRQCVYIRVAHSVAMVAVTLLTARLDQISRQSVPSVLTMQCSLHSSRFLGLNVVDRHVILDKDGSENHPKQLQSHEFRIWTGIVSVVSEDMGSVATGAIGRGPAASGTGCWPWRWTRASRDGGSRWGGAADKRDQAHWLAERGFVWTPIAVYHNRGGQTYWTGGTRGWISQGTRTISGFNTGAQGVATGRLDRKAAIVQRGVGTTNWRVNICVRGKWPPPVLWVIPRGTRSHAWSRSRKVRRRTHWGGAADGWAYKVLSGIAVTRNVDKVGTGQFQ